MIATEVSIMIAAEVSIMISHWAGQKQLLYVYIIIIEIVRNHPTHK